MSKPNLYTGTLIFCIIAAVVALSILVMFFLINVEPVKYMLLTITLILVIIIIHSIITIYMYERKIKKYNDVSNNQPIPGLTCPDYFTRRLDKTTNTQYCENVYDTDKTIFIIGSTVAEPQISINLSDMSKKIALDACNDYNSNYAERLPWTDLKALCETVI